MNLPSPILVTIPEALRMIGLGRSYFYERLAAGDIRSVKAGKRRLIDVSSLKSWAASLPAEGFKIPASEGATHDR
jgi:excisionase family DNA binding protein